jgi:hypothetical protein
MRASQAFLKAMAPTVHELSLTLLWSFTVTSRHLGVCTPWTAVTVACRLGCQDGRQSEQLGFPAHNSIQGQWQNYSMIANLIHEQWWEEGQGTKFIAEVEVAGCSCHFLHDRIKSLIISSYCMILQCNLVGFWQQKGQGECLYAHSSVQHLANTGA